MFCNLFRCILLGKLSLKYTHIFVIYGAVDVEEIEYAVEYIVLRDGFDAFQLFGTV